MKLSMRNMQLKAEYGNEIRNCHGNEKKKYMKNSWQDYSDKLYVNIYALSHRQRKIRVYYKDTSGNSVWE